MITAVSPHKIVEYISLCERELADVGRIDECTIFLLQHPGMGTTKDVDNETVSLPTAEEGDQRTQVTGGTQTYMTLLYGIKGFKRLKDPDGGEIKFRNSTEEELIASIERVPANIRTEITNELRQNKDGNKSLMDRYEERLRKLKAKMSQLSLEDEDAPEEKSKVKAIA